MPDGMGPPPSNTISPNDFLGFVSEYTVANREKDRSVGKVRNIRKRMEEQGCDMHALDLFLSFRKLDPEEAETRLRNALRYCQWADMQMGGQGKLFVEGVDMPSDKAKTLLKEAEIYNDGHAAGMAGRSVTSSGIAAGTPFHQKWVTAWHDGQSELCALHDLPPSENGEPVKAPKKSAKTKPGATAAPAGERQSERGKDKPSGDSKRSPKPTPEEMARIDQIAAGNA